MLPGRARARERGGFVGRVRRTWGGAASAVNATRIMHSAAPRAMPRSPPHPSQSPFIQGDVGAVALMEQGCKFVFKRPRPNWRKPNLYYCMPCEWWSFPSGHAMRAGFLGCVICSEVSPFRSITDQVTDCAALFALCGGESCGCCCRAKHRRRATLHDPLH